MKKGFKALSHKHKSLTLDVIQGIIHKPSQTKSSHTEEQNKQTFACRDDHTQLLKRMKALKNENQAVKNKNEALKKENQDLKRKKNDLRSKLSKRHACSLCSKSFNRSDGLYKHL